MGGTSKAEGGTRKQISDFRGTAGEAKTVPDRGEAPPSREAPRSRGRGCSKWGLLDFAPGHRREGVIESAIGDVDALATVLE